MFVPSYIRKRMVWKHFSSERVVTEEFLAGNGVWGLGQVEMISGPSGLQDRYWTLMYTEGAFDI